MDHLPTPGSAPAAFALRPVTVASRSAAAPRTVSAEVAAAADSATESSAKANYQDALLFIIPPLLSAAVLGALSVNLHRIPSAHPLADASLLCAGAAAILITAWWFISFIYALFYAWSLRVSSHNADRAVLKVPAFFRPRFMRRIVLTLGGTALGVGGGLGSRSGYGSYAQQRRSKRHGWTVSDNYFGSHDHRFNGCRSINEHRGGRDQPSHRLRCGSCQYHHGQHHPGSALRSPGPLC